MRHSHKTLAFLLVTMLGIYGCAKGPITQTGDEKSTREKLQKLEADHRSAIAARDSFQKKLAEVEEQQAQTRQELEQFRSATAREKSELHEQLKTRLAERDALQVQYDGFRKNIKELLGQAEASLPNSPSHLAKTTTENATRN